jgi:uncharacterized protein
VHGLGTVINVIAIVAGTVAGLLVGPRLPDRMRETILHAVGLVVVAIGLSQVIASDNIVFPLVAVVMGTILGELLRIEDRLESIGVRLRKRFERAPGEGGGVGGPPPTHREGVGGPPPTYREGVGGPPPTHREGVGGPPPTDREEPSTFVEGFVAASLLFCVGPLAILGAIQDGLTGELELLVVKSALDGLVSVIFAATLGWGVGFSVLPVLIYQGAITLLAGGADSVLDDRMVLEMTAAGGVMIMGIGLRLLEIRQVRVGSMLPALVIAPVLVSLFAR